MRSSAEIGATVDTLQRERVDAVHFFLSRGSSPAMSQPGRIAVQQRWPTALSLPPHAQAGILLAYGFRKKISAQAGLLRDRILRGTPPGDMPVEQPTRIYRR